MRRSGFASLYLALTLVSVLVCVLVSAAPARGAFAPGLAALAATPVGPSTADLETGDLLVGAGTALDPNFGTLLGAGIFRVRGAAAALYCESPVTDADGTVEHFGIPTDVIVDSDGRVVFLAKIPGPSFGNYGLYRCDRMGSMPTKLVNFAHETSSNPGWPIVVQGVSSQGGSVTGLYLSRQRRIVVDDALSGGAPRVVTEDAYGLGVGFAAGFNPANHDVLQTVKSVRYYPDGGELDLDGPMITHVDNGRSTPDVTFHRGTTYSVDSDALRRTVDPLSMRVSGTLGGTSFSAKLSLFGRSDEVRGIIVDDLNEPNVDSGCSAQPNVSNLMPPILGGLAGLYNVVFDEFGSSGIVIASNNGFVRTPYLTQVSEALLDDPNDLSQYFTMPGLGCTPMPTAQFRSILPFLEGVVVNAHGSLASSSSGLVGVMSDGSIARIASPHVQTLASGFIFPGGIAAYPSGVTPGTGVTLVIRVDSPVNVLLTDSGGKRIGVDAAGHAINDFGANGFDSGPGEPRFFAIEDPTPGSYGVQSVGTGSGAFTVHVYSADLTQPLGGHIRESGAASAGSTATHDFTLSAAGAITFDSVPPSAAPTSTALASSVNPSVVGQQVMLTATVNAMAGTPTGEVTFMDGTAMLGAAALSDATATLPISTLATGTHGITAQYGGVTGFAASTSPVLSQVVAATDTTSPVISCPANITTKTDPGRATAVVNYPAPTATDNAGTPTVSTQPASGSTFPLGSTSVHATASDAAHNTTSCTFTVNVRDMEAPTFKSVPADVTTATAPGQCTATVQFPVATATDNVAVTSISSTLPRGGVYPLGATAVTYTARDAAGNSTEAVQTVTVRDNEAPRIVAPPNLTTRAAPGATYATSVSLGSPTSTDNCDVSSVTNNAPERFLAGDTLVIWTARDASGNTASATQTVTVQIPCPATVTFPLAIPSANGAVLIVGTIVTTESGILPTCQVAYLLSVRGTVVGAGTLVANHVDASHIVLTKGTIVLLGRTVPGSFTGTVISTPSSGQVVIVFTFPNGARRIATTNYTVTNAGQFVITSTTVK